MHIPFILTRSKLKRWCKSEVILLHLIVRRWPQNLRFIAESVEPDYLDSRVFEVDSRVEVKQQLAQVAGIGDKGFETIDCQSGVEGMTRRERVFSIAEILPTAETAYEHT